LANYVISGKITQIAIICALKDATRYIVSVIEHFHQSHDGIVCTSHKCGYFWWTVQARPHWCKDGSYQNIL